MVYLKVLTLTAKYTFFGKFLFSLPLPVRAGHCSLSTAKRLEPIRNETVIDLSCKYGT
jgi:hypothetical protein